MKLFINAPKEVNPNSKVVINLSNDPVAFFLPPAGADSRGNATIELTIPSYMGKVRIMVVAVNEHIVSSAENSIEVKAPLVMIPTIPRSLKVGDKFSLPIEVLGLIQR